MSIINTLWKFCPILNYTDTSQQTVIKLVDFTKSLYSGEYYNNYCYNYKILKYLSVNYTCG